MNALPPQHDIARALGLGTVVDLAHPLEVHMPCSPSHPGFRMALIGRHDDGATDMSGANELIVTGGHVGTHIDALCHAARGGKLYGGHDAVEASRGGRFTVHGIETVPPLLCRGVLADIAALKQTPRLPAEYGITRGDLEQTLDDLHVEPGDVVLVRTGWPQLYADPDAYVGYATGVPGLTEDAAIYLANLGVRAVGSDTIATDQIFAGQGHRALPAHFVLLADRGIPIIEVLDLEELAARGAREFIFIAIPLKIAGATGSPIRPLAVLAEREAPHESR